MENQQSHSLRSLAFLTSGGDAPGMNAAIRAVVRACVYYGIVPYGVKRGYQGMIEGEIEKMHVRSVSRILSQGGTILKSSRSEDFRSKEGRQKAYDNLKELDVDGLIVIGGNGTFTGASVFTQEFDIPTIGIPGTIDNDLYGTDYTIGYDTATNVITECVDKIRDTASSHDRLFFVEVMGRDSGFLALRAGVATGAIAVMLPEQKRSIDELVKILEYGAANNKTSSVVIVAEGESYGGAYEVARQVNERYSNYDTKVTILGHLQRGGSPTCFDRVLASQMGVRAVEALIKGSREQMVATVNNRLELVPFAAAIAKKSEIDEEMRRMASILSI
ncbi:MAG: 6-phosphofructokinase [Flavobacteriales bacterium]|nr:6-phosphofructokinase [Flavobacteriales bacterium]